VSVYEKLHSLGIDLPVPAAPVASFVPVVRTGNLVFLSGHIAQQAGKPLAGKLGADFTTEQGQAAARSVAIELLGTLHAALDLNSVKLLNLDVRHRAQRRALRPACRLLSREQPRAAGLAARSGATAAAASSTCG
jgi:enamine deaminase RidA (YjgF/YER057c/UK114 family)